MPLLRNYGWMAPATILLGIVASLAETIGLSLFVPLLQGLNGSGFEIGSGALPNFFPAVFSHLPASSPLPYIIGLILMMTVVKSVLIFSHSVLAARVNARATHTLRTQVFARTLSVSQSQMDTIGTGRLINLLATDTWHTSDAISLLLGLVINVCSIAVFTLLLVALSWKLTLLVVLGVAIVSVIIQIVTRAARRLGKEGVDANTTLSDHMLDALEGVREIQMFGLRRHRQALFDGLSDRVRSIFLRLDLFHRATAPLSELLYVSLLLGLLLAGVAAHGSIPSIIVFLLVLYRLQPQIRQVDSARLSLVSLTTSVEEVMRFLQPPAAPVLDSRRIAGPLPIDFERGEAIEFEDVSFAYDLASEFRIEHLNISIPLGQSTGIVGRSGSGKSTLVSLLARFYEPSGGRILIGGRALSAVDVDAWRSRIAWVSQDAHLFRATIRENIRYGRLDATDDEILSAARDADAHDFICSLPDGYDTRVGSGGTDLSSGQVQRITLARAIVRKPEILILDEATNSLDSLSEEFIRARLETMPGPHTLLTISHRLSAVRGADHVIVLDGGRVSEQGPPSLLSRRRGFFARVKELQHAD
ncbi:MAG TPA: ABC transporter ATP-binding protein [Bryobacteraceae bacterium]|nr:ABC transporter ATP-binding protein [Bryobacteraceae bacterium]